MGLIFALICAKMRHGSTLLTAVTILRDQKPDYLLLSHTSPPVQPPLGFLLTLLPSFSPFVDSQGVIF